MGRRSTQPRDNTVRGRLLQKVLSDHPILQGIWVTEANSFIYATTDFRILKSLVKKYEEKERYNYKLPYSTTAHIKLKNILKYGRIN